MGVSLDAVVRDWIEETWSLEAVVAALHDDGWRTPTPAPGWAIAHQVAHLAWTDEALTVALTDPGSFAGLRARAPRRGPPGRRRRGRGRRGESGQPGPSLADRPAPHRPPAAPMPPKGPDPLDRPAHGSGGRSQRPHHGDLRPRPGRARCPGAAARALPATSPCASSGRGRLPFSFANRGLEATDVPVRVEVSYGDQTWAWGPEDAADRVTGGALDLALLATRRRHRSDCHIEATGKIADAWLDIAQAYAGPPGPGRETANGTGAAESERSARPVDRRIPEDP